MAVGLVVCVLVGVVAGVLVSVTAIGPVILTVSRGHGLHLGDVPIIGAALLVVVALMADRKDRTPRDPGG